MNEHLRSLAVATTSLVGFEVDLAFGPSLGWRGRFVQIPEATEGKLTRLLLSLQAASMAQRPVGAEEPSGWALVIQNLLVTSALLLRLPGLIPAAKALEDEWWEGASRSGGTTDPGYVLLRSLLAPDHNWQDDGDRAPRVEPGPISGALRGWLRQPVGPPPLPTFQPPSLLPKHHALPLEESEVVPNPSLGGSQSLAGPQPMLDRDSSVIAIGSADSSIPRVLVIAPPPMTQEALTVESAGAAPTADPAAGHPPPCLHAEWDCEVSAYRPRWCSVYDLAAPADRPDPSALSAPSDRRRVRRLFESHSDRAPAWRRGLDGEEIDIDAVVDSAAQGQLGAGERVYCDREHSRGGHAVAVVADLSESTGGWTLGLEKSALELLGEALDAVGDEFCLTGFRGRSKDDCQVVWIKAFEERWGLPIRHRIRSLRALGYTRIAPSLRHMAETMAQSECRHRTVLLISDGIPYDVSGYGGQYAIEDTRRAFYELRAQGIKPYCLTIDITAPRYLDRMCGPAAWALVRERERLPQALLALYRRVRF